MINKALYLNYKLTYFISSLEEVKMTVFVVHHEKQITNNTFLQKKVLVYYNKVKKCHNIASLEGHKFHLKPIVEGLFINQQEQDQLSVSQLI